MGRRSVTGDACVWRLRIQGRVQGVWYRGWMVQHASSLGLDGWVRNRSDGSVEAVISGPPDRLEEMRRRCRTGPRAAEVSRVDVGEEPTVPEPGFCQWPTV
jgi:acylphosphatase